MKNFEMFGLYHLLIIAIIFLGITILYLSKEKIKANQKIIVRMRYSLAILHTVFELSYYIYAIVTKRSILTTFPLELCAIALYLSVLFLITKKQIFWQISYPLSIVGGLIALFLGNPDGYGLISYRFIHFFVGHGLLIFSNLFAVWVLNYRMRLKEFKRFMYILLIIAGFTYIINLITGANFMYLRSLPSPVNFVSDMLGPIYILPLIIIFTFLYYIPVLCIKWVKE